ncbi:MAG: T9SS type A sorting domain-containing protein [Bacteroidia bacterium]
MIKKILLLIVSVAFVGLTNSNAQCTPGPQTAGGIYPDSAQGLPNGFVGTAYATTMTVVVPTDTVVSGIPIPIDSLVLINFTGFPPVGGFTYICNPNHCSWKGGTKGCVLISGNPTVADTGTWHLSATVNAYIGGSGTPIPEHINYYKIKILNATGIATLDMTKFEVGQNSPNPFTQTTKIIFTMPTVAPMTLSVYNVLGTLIMQSKFQAEKGYNSYELSANDFPSGIYMYSLNNGKTSITKRMIVAGK